MKMRKRLVLSLVPLLHAIGFRLEVLGFWLQKKADKVDRARRM